MLADYEPRSNVAAKTDILLDQARLLDRPSGVRRPDDMRFTHKSYR
jgi:hypothetical protein